MPHLIIRGLSVEQVRAISGPLVDELAELCQCPADHFLLECLHTTAVCNGYVVSSYPFVEVAWFERGSEVRDPFAKVVDRHVRSLRIPEAEIAFRAYREDAYYRNGEPAGSAAHDTDTAALQRELNSLREANGILHEQLRKARKTPAASSESNMSSRLRDALRE
jgi:hypothetical protein